MTVPTCNKKSRPITFMNDIHFLENRQIYEFRSHVSVVAIHELTNCASQVAVEERGRDDFSNRIRGREMAAADHLRTAHPDCGAIMSCAISLIGRPTFQLRL